MDKVLNIDAWTSQQLCAYSKPVSLILSTLSIYTAISLGKTLLTRGYGVSRYCTSAL